MTKIACFFLTPTDRQRLSLRQYADGSAAGPCPNMPGEHSYHDAMAVGVLGEIPIERNEHGGTVYPKRHEVGRDDPRWPGRCSCGYVFRSEDRWQLFNESLYTRSDNGETTTLHDAPAGALWYADWMPSYRTWAGPDGHILVCKTPGGDWIIDSRASNCTLPNDNEHRCWVRHGDPTDPLGLRTGQPLHVDKNGRTCNAGAGSIGMGDYHGFLHNGCLVQC